MVREHQISQLLRSEVKKSWDATANRIILRICSEKPFIQVNDQNRDEHQMKNCGKIVGKISTLMIEKRAIGRFKSTYERLQ